MERTYGFKNAKAEVGDKFRNVELRYNVPDAPKDGEDFDGFLTGVRSTGINALTAHALFASAYALEWQKEAKDATKEEGVTPENIQEKMSSRTIERALRGSGTGTVRKPSGKLKAKAVEEDTRAEYDRLKAEGADPAVLAYFESRLAKIEAAKASTPESGAGEEAPTNGGAEPLADGETRKGRNRK